MDNASKLPRHVSLIMDGNGRWAAQRGKDRIHGHFEGVESVRAVMEASAELGIEYISFFAFSQENWGRPEAEVTALMELLASTIEKEQKTLMDNNIKLLILGNKLSFSPKLRSAMENIEKITSGNSGMTVILFLSYSGKWDIYQAALRLAHDLNGEAGRKIDIEDFSDYLVTAGIPDPDLLIRTSGEKRISNYMLWQTAYTEFVFTDTLWPDFRKQHYLAALEEYASRQRRFGKVI